MWGWLTKLLSLVGGDTNGGQTSGSNAGALGAIGGLLGGGGAGGAGGVSYVGGADAPTSLSQGIYQGVGGFGQQPLTQAATAAYAPQGASPYVSPTVNSAANDDLLRKFGKGALSAGTGAMDAIGGIDQRLTDVRFPSLSQGQFAPNDNPGQIGIAELLKMIAQKRY